MSEPTLEPVPDPPPGDGRDHGPVAAPRELLHTAAARVTAGVRGVNRHSSAVALLRRTRQALPGDSGFGDPLSVAGRDSAGTIARLAGRLFDDQPTVTREVTLSGLQVWHALLERTGRVRGSGEVTIVFTDLVGFSDWAMRAGDSDSLQLLRNVAAATEPAIISHRGTVVKRLGDGLMAVFPTPQLALDAVAACLEGVDTIEVCGWRPRLRVGVHTGNPRRIGDDYLGVDVNIAARLGEKAGPGEILISETTRAGLDPTRVATRRKRLFRLVKVKGVPDKIEVHVATPR